LPPVPVSRRMSDDLDHISDEYTPPIISPATPAQPPETIVPKASGVPGPIEAVVWSLDS